MSQPVDAVVVGAGPNGLMAAITLARAGRSVHLIEAAATPGGGMRSDEGTLPGFVHDVCSSVHPLGAASPAFAPLHLERHGLRWLEPEVAVAHPLDGGRAAAMWRSLDETADRLGGFDGRAYRRYMGQVVRNWDRLAPAILGPLARLPAHPLTLAGFGVRAVPPAALLARAVFRGEEARALFAGSAAHAVLPLTVPLTSAFGTVLMAAGHMVGWPVIEGGSQRLADALTAILREMGGQVTCGRPVRTAADLPPARAVLFDLTPRQIVDIGGHLLPGRYRRSLERFRYGPGTFKIDYALSGPVPWTAEVCRRAGTVHVGGTLAEISEAEAAPHAGRHADRPFVLVVQPCVADPSRSPAGQATLWAYCHVPSGSTVDMTDRIEAQIERYAPGFRDVILHRRVMGPAALEAHNANYLGGDISAGSHGGVQMVLRPFPRLHPYRIPGPNWFICSASTPPGAGVHGMCGYHAARDALDSALR